MMEESSNPMGTNVFGVGDVAREPADEPIDGSGDRGKILRLAALLFQKTLIGGDGQLVATFVFDVPGVAFDV